MKRTIVICSLAVVLTLICILFAVHQRWIWLAVSYAVSGLITPLYVENVLDRIKRSKWHELLVVFGEFLAFGCFGQLLVSFMAVSQEIRARRKSAKPARTRVISLPVQ